MRPNNADGGDTDEVPYNVYQKRRGNFSQSKHSDERSQPVQILREFYVHPRPALFSHSCRLGALLSALSDSDKQNKSQLIKANFRLLNKMALRDIFESSMRDIYHSTLESKPMFGHSQKMIDSRSTAEFFRSARRADVLALSKCFFYLGPGPPLLQSTGTPPSPDLCNGAETRCRDL
jgi:hypothetical protein